MSLRAEVKSILGSQHEGNEDLASLAIALGISDLLERIALAIEGQLALQQKIYDMQIDPEAQAEHQAKVAQAAEKFFDPDRQGEQMAAVQIAAGKVVQQYQREHPLGVQFAPPPRRS